MWCPDCNCVEHKVFRAVLPSGFDGIEHTTFIPLPITLRGVVQITG